METKGSLGDVELELEGDVIFSHISFLPSPKRIKIDLTEDCQDVPLRCSTPQPAENHEDFCEDGKLDATLEILGISHDSIGLWVLFLGE